MLEGMIILARNDVEMKVRICFQVIDSCRLFLTTTSTSPEILYENMRSCLNTIIRSLKGNRVEYMNKLM